MIINFTILGNQENPAGNPIPYTRVVGRALWTAAAKRYAAWKDYVVRSYFEKENLGGMPVVLDDSHGKGFLAIKKGARKPINLGTKMRMDLKIFWRDGKHGDPDNIFKGIADAIFVNDKNLDGSFVSRTACDGKGKVEVKIKILKNKTDGNKTNQN